MEFIKDDGGRSVAGFKGATGDCTTRAIAIAADLPYLEVYERLNELVPITTPRGRKPGSARTGVHRRTYEALLDQLGFEWVPTMSIGSGCQVHLRDGELPDGRLVVRLSGHMTAVVDGVIRDAYDPSRGGTRCVYGYFTQTPA